MDLIESEPCVWCTAVPDKGSLKFHAYVGVAVGEEMTGQPFDHHKEPKATDERGTDPVSPVMLRRDAEMSDKFGQSPPGHLTETALQHCRSLRVVGYHQGRLNHCAHSRRTLGVVHHELLTKLTELVDEPARNQTRTLVVEPTIQGSVGCFSNYCCSHLYHLASPVP